MIIINYMYACIIFNYKCINELGNLHALPHYKQPHYL